MVSSLSLYGGVCKVILLSNPTVVLRLGWGFDNTIVDYLNAMAVASKK